MTRGVSFTPSLDEVGIKDLFNNRVKNSNSDINSQGSKDYESDQDSKQQTNSEDYVPNDVVNVPSYTNLIDLGPVSQFKPSLLGDSGCQLYPLTGWWCKSA